MQIRTVRIQGRSFAECAVEFKQLASDQTADLAFCFGNEKAIGQLNEHKNLSQIAKHWLAGTSCLSCADQDGINNKATHNATLLLITDSKGHYGVGSAELVGDIKQQASAALQRAMDAAGKSHELPTLIWCLQAPGCEELVLTGIQELVGTEVPIFGGSTADDDISGKWLQFDGYTLSKNNVLIAVLYPSAPISSYFSSGYCSTGYTGTATSVNQRTIQRIDDKPAAAVYNSWRQQVGATTLTPGNILKESTWFPLGREISQHSSLPFFLLSHPVTLLDDGGISLFSEIKEGEQLWLMSGSKENLVARAGEVVRTARQNLKMQYNCEVAGAIIVYCAGCMLAVKDNLTEVQCAIKAELGNVPFIITFTFGEQGCFIDGSNRHGNLMISAVLIGAQDANQ